MRYLFLLIFIIATIAAGAQQYTPFPTTNATWRYRCTEWYDTTTKKMGLRDILYILDGTDTVIQGNTYKKVMMRSHYTPYTNGNPTIPIPIMNVTADHPDVFCGGIRESNKRIYFFEARWPTQEVCFFDFNLNIGDTMYVWGGWSKSVINFIDSIRIGTKYHKRFNFQPSSYGGRTLRIIEGMGPASHQLFILENGQNSATLHCYNGPDGMYSDRTYAYPCSYIYPYGTPTSVNNISSNATIKAFPNPFNNELHINTQGNANLYNSMGQKVIEQAIDGKQTINTSQLAAGVYYLTLKDKEGNIVAQQKVVKE